MRRLILAVVLGFVVVVLVVAQIFFPGIAEQNLRDRLSHSGKVLHVEVDAFPAIKLLWRHADKVVVRMADYHSTTSHLGSTLSQAGDVGSLDASAQVITSGLLTLRDASLRKRGN